MVTTCYLDFRISVLLDESLEIDQQIFLRKRNAVAAIGNTKLRQQTNRQTNDRGGDGDQTEFEEGAHPWWFADRLRDA